MPYPPITNIWLTINYIIFYTSDKYTERTLTYAQVTITVQVYTVKGVSNQHS